MRAVVTGGAGFIGSNLVDALLRQGAEVQAVDDLSAGRRANLEDAVAAGAGLDVVDVVDADALRGAVVPFSPDVIFHLAAQADVRKAVNDPVRDAKVNVLGTINSLDCARETGARLIFAATGGAAYGEGEGRRVPFIEADPVAPETPYGVSKVAGELYADMYRRLHGVPTVSLRFGNVYGPRQDPHGEAGVVAIFCGRLLGDEPVTVFGDGRQTRDYVFVGDAVEALLAADLHLQAAGAASQSPMNIGTGLETSVIDVIDALAATSGRSLNIEWAPARPGEVQRVAIDPARAATELGWSAVTTMEVGLAETLESVRSERRT